VNAANRLDNPYIMKIILPLVCLILLGACASTTRISSTRARTRLPGVTTAPPFSAATIMSIDADAEKPSLTLAGKFALYLKHYEHDHFSSDAWTQAFEGDELYKNLVWVAAFGASLAFDDNVERHFTKDKKLYGKVAQLDDWFLIAFPLTTAAMTLIAPPGKFENRYDYLAAFNETILAAGATSFILKSLINRKRPNDHDNNSFPSNHAVITFATAKYISETWGDEYGWKVKVPAYALAGFIATARLERKKHKLSDVVAGAAIGYLIGDIFTHWHFGKGGINEKANLTFIPAISPTGVGLFAEYKF